MGQISLPGNPEIAVIVRRSARARRMSLRLSQIDGRVTLTLPDMVSETEGRAFLRDKESWLRRHLEARPEAVAIRPGSVVPIEGRAVTVEQGQGRQVRFDGDHVAVPGDPTRMAARLRGWLRARARDRLVSASDRHAAALGRPYSAITLRDTRSRWGSCTADGRLMYSWRLILAPPEILDYVAAHEVAHLREMNHSPAFWSCVDRLYGDWRPARTWLRENGASLHQVRFES